MINPVHHQVLGQYLAAMRQERLSQPELAPAKRLEPPRQETDAPKETPKTLKGRHVDVMA